MVKGTKGLCSQVLFFQGEGSEGRGCATPRVQTNQGFTEPNPIFEKDKFGSVNRTTDFSKEGFGYFNRTPNSKEKEFGSVNRTPNFHIWVRLNINRTLKKNIFVSTTQTCKMCILNIISLT